MLSTSFSAVTTGLPEVDAVAASIAEGRFDLSVTELINKLIDICMGEFRNLAGYLLVFVALGLLVNILDLFGENSSVANTGFFAVYAALASVGIKCYYICLDYAVAVIGDITDFITKLSPVLATLIVTSGKSVSAAAFHPVLSVAVFVITAVCNQCILPFASYSLILTVADNISDKVSVSGICKFLSSSSKWILTLCFTIFTGICALYGFSAPGIDALSAKTVKFAVGSLIPVVGGFLSETLETVVTGSRLMKNAVGTAGMVVLCATAVIPVIKIGTMALAVKLGAAVTEAVTDKRVAGLLNGISSSITILFGLVATVSVLFIINISIILAATG